jgi:molybdate transport system ATP-binding protein
MTSGSQPAAGLRAAFGLARGVLTLDVELDVRAGEALALVGPNGAGKTSCLRALAGLERIGRGRIACGDEVLDGGPGGPFVPPERRGVGFVFQDHLLFPHLSALDNAAFGLRSRGVPRRAARASAASWLERVGLGDRLDVRPDALSGGQAQRVALARALATEPRLLLLDEPLAAVDASARIELRRELRTHLASFSGACVLVAHEVGDAFALADRLAVLEEGRIVQTGTVLEIVGRPRSRYVADLVGLNCFRGTCRDGVVELASGARLVAASTGTGPVIAPVHPRAVTLSRERPVGSARNAWSAPIAGLEPALDTVRVRVGGSPPLVAEVTRAAVAELGLAGGGEVWVALKATEIGVGPA